MTTKIQIRRDTAANWTSNNPTLANGEMGYETDTNKLKVGNGSSAWSSLSYYTLGTADYLALAGGTMTGQLTLSEVVETAYTLTGSDVDPANGTMQRKTTTGAETITGSNFAIGQSVILTLSAATSVSFTGFTWVSTDGAAPTILSSNDTFVLWMDSGSNKYVAYVGGTA